VTITGTAGAVRHAIESADLSALELTSAVEFVGSEERLAAAHLILDSTTRAKQIVDKMNDALLAPGPKGTGFLGMASVDPAPRTDATLVRLRPLIRKDKDLLICPSLGHKAPALGWFIRLHRTILNDGLILAEGARIALTGSSPWLVAYAPPGSYNNLLQWCDIHRVSIDAPDPPKLWALHIEAASEPRVDAQRVRTAKTVAAITAACGKAERVTIRDKAAIRITFEAPKDFRPSTTSWQTNDEEGDFLFRLAAPDWQLGTERVEIIPAPHRRPREPDSTRSRPPPPPPKPAQEPPSFAFSFPPLASIPPPPHGAARPTRSSPFKRQRVSAAPKPPPTSSPSPSSSDSTSDSHSDHIGARPARRHSLIPPAVAKGRRPKPPSQVPPPVAPSSSPPSHQAAVRRNSTTTQPRVRPPPQVGPTSTPRAPAPNPPPTSIVPDGDPASLGPGVSSTNGASTSCPNGPSPPITSRTPPSVQSRPSGTHTDPAIPIDGPSVPPASSSAQPPASAAPHRTPSASRRPPVFYAVAVGREGKRIYASWPETFAATNKFPGTLHQKFDSEIEAQRYLDSFPTIGDTSSQ